MSPIRLPYALVLALTGLGSSAQVSTADETHLEMRIEGHGPRTVVLAAGLGDTLDAWSTVQPLIATHCTRTLAYTRAGYPGSDAATGARDAATIVAELRSELKRRGIAPPYVLVGHSLGGLYMQYFARQYPNEILGLLLIDSTHWNQQLQLSLQVEHADNRLRTVLFLPWIVRREVIDSETAGQQVHTSPHAGNVPTIVLARARALVGETPESRALEARLQDDIATDFPSARYLRVNDSGHYIQRDHPDAVVAAARELAGCAPLVAKVEHRARTVAR